MLLMIPVLSATVTANSPPTAPDIDGPTSGKAGVPQTYTFTSTDPDGDDISYYIEWCCEGSGETETTDFYPSGEPATASHTYGSGTFVIRVTAIDINQAESDPSTLSVTMPKNKPYINTPFLQFLQQYPILYQLLLRFLRL